MLSSPGTTGIGESTGMTDRQQIIQQQAQIVLDGIEVMKAHSDIDPDALACGSKHGRLRDARVLTMTDDIAFMICTSCPGMAGVDQGAYLGASQAVCGGVPEEEADQLSSLLLKLDKVRTYETYDEYLQYREVLAALTGIDLIRVPAAVPTSYLSKRGRPNDPATRAGGILSR